MILRGVRAFFSKPMVDTMSERDSGVSGGWRSMIEHAAHHLLWSREVAGRAHGQSHYKQILLFSLINMFLACTIC